MASHPHSAVQAKKAQQHRLPAPRMGSHQCLPPHGRPLDHRRHHKPSPQHAPRCRQGRHPRLAKRLWHRRPDLQLPPEVHSPHYHRYHHCLRRHQKHRRFRHCHHCPQMPDPARQPQPKQRKQRVAKVAEQARQMKRRQSLVPHFRQRLQPSLPDAPHHCCLLHPHEVAPLASPMSHQGLHPWARMVHHCRQLIQWRRQGPPHLLH
mmetsp:Transcript_101775/g.255159  ORF Transcript_101775/g.255159 Transcript_101775/m.255159 type:complete len:206 (+) Transcript_101775:913-1530(+)